MNHAENMKIEAARFVARTAIDAAESMATDDRVMIHQGIMELFPKDSAEWGHAKAASDALLEFKKNQLNLFKSLDA